MTTPQPRALVELGVLQLFWFELLGGVDDLTIIDLQARGGFSHDELVPCLTALVECAELERVPPPTTDDDRPATYRLPRAALARALRVSAAAMARS